MSAIENIRMAQIDSKTLGEFIAKHYQGFDICDGSAPMDMDVTHGVEIETSDNSKYGYGVSVRIYPYIKWSDGGYKPCHYWGNKYYIWLERR